MSTVYAVAKTVPKTALAYITPGKKYEAKLDYLDQPSLFSIVDDQGGMLICRWPTCSHLDGQSWARIDEEGGGGLNERVDRCKCESAGVRHRSHLLPAASSRAMVDVRWLPGRQGVARTSIRPDVEPVRQPTHWAPLPEPPK